MKCTNVSVVVAVCARVVKSFPLTWRVWADVHFSIFSFTTNFVLCYIPKPTAFKNFSVRNVYFPINCSTVWS